MTAKELIVELQKIPGDYEVQVILGILGRDPTKDIQAISAFIISAYPNHDIKAAYIFGSALPALPTHQPN